MLSDPQSVTIGSSTFALPRTNVGGNKAEYTSADGLIRLTAAHTYGRRTRRVLRLDHSKVAPDPLISSTNIRFSMSNYIVFDVPPGGYTNSEVLSIWGGFHDVLVGNSNAVVTKLLGGES